MKSGDGDLCFRSASELAHLVRERDISARELLRRT